MKKMGRIFSVITIAAVILALAYTPRQESAADSFGLTAAAAAADVSASEQESGLTLAFYAGSPYALVNGERRLLDQSSAATAQTHSDTLYVPLRFIAEVYDGQAGWDAPSRTATLKCQGRNISYTADSSEMRVDGKKISITAPALLTDGRLYIPLVSFAEAIGADFSETIGTAEFSGHIAVIGDSAGELVQFEELLASFTALPVVGTEEKFIELMNGLRERESVRLYGGVFDRGMEIGISVDVVEEAAFDTATGTASSAPAEAPMPMPQAEAAVTENQSAKSAAAVSGGGDYSATNVQVEGVDEADVIKTDGEYIYYAKNSTVWIVKATPADGMKLVSTVTFPEQTGKSDGFYPQDMYVDGGELVVIGNATRMFYVNGMPNYQSMTRAYVYDISDPAAPKKTREVESEGNYLSSRKIGKTVYMLSNSWIYSIADGVYPMPMYRDTAVADAYKEVGYGRICYFPDFTVNNYLFITGFETDKPRQEAKLSSYLGSGQSVYVSQENMYVTSADYAQPVSLDMAKLNPQRYEPATAVYKFALDNGNVFYENKATVPGTVLNQFSMDEYDGYFRIATTGYNDNGQQINGLYILNDKLEITGKLDDMAPGERIYSARFMGKRAYVVTFKQVDPLFVIELDPKAPKVLGALKIPGYSNYLHPYDENHLIGIGKDTVETKDAALYQGMKLSLFDVTDVANPKEMFVEIIGDRGTESPVLYDHKALLFDRNRGLLAFPVSIATLSEEQKSDAWQYGEFTFQGAYVYNLDLDNGFALKGEITHMSEQDMLKAGMYNWDYSKMVERIIRIGDNLYTASPTMIKSTGMDDMKEIGSVELK